MKHFRLIHIIAVIVAAALIGVGCSNENDNTLTSQQTNIANYLKSSHQPRLIPESELSSSLDEKPEYYVQWGLDLYRYIATMYEEGRDSKAEVAMGNTLSLRYSAYIFTNRTPAIDALYATNDETMIAQLESAGLNTSYEWTTDPYVITLGTSEIVQGLETALVGCREGDTVEIYMTYEQAYGKDYIGMVPSKSAVVWYIDILSVTK